jgi:N-acetylglutamate synthase/N-acetylornithine aminotransferase
MTSSTKNSKMTTPHKRFNMGGIHTVVYNLDAALASSHPIAVLVASHGLMGKQFDLKNLVAGIFEGTRKLEEQDRDGRTRRREIVIVTLDQRNHGERFVDDEANQYLAKNERHP